MDRIHQLFNKYKNNACTPDEVQELLAYFKHADAEELLKGHIESALNQQPAEDDELQNDIDEVYNNLQQHIFNKKAGRNRSRYIKLAAACLIACIAFGGYLVVRKQRAVRQIALNQKHDLLPGTDKAILTIANGQKIDLSDAGDGKLTTQGSIAVNKTKDGRIVYEHAAKNAGSAQLIYNTMTTPRGGQHQLTLSDGTVVWLDAASSITFPVVFSGNERAVAITGQAYFEVAHNAAKPFKVSANGQTVQVLGTHFNINAYTDEPEMKTTLLEGSIKISKDGNTEMLVPGQQAVIAANKKTIIVKAADTEEAIAWHMGLFKFNNASIQMVMRQLSRWYDVDISYEGNIPDRRFSGEIYRNVNASKIAEILSYKKIHFRIDGRRIIVLP